MRPIGVPQGKVGTGDMYSIRKAAAIFGITEKTVRTWMKQWGLKIKIVETDRRRAYITDEDMDTLADRIAEKVIRSEKKTMVSNRNGKKVLTIGEVKYYSLAATASILRVSVLTVKRWVKQDNIEKTLFTTDTRRVYITKDDVLRLAELHWCQISEELLSEMNIPREVNTTPPDMDKLCTLKEAALYLGVARSTLINWIREDNIEKTMTFTDRERAYIAYRDVLGLAERHGREVAPDPPSLTVAEEIKKMKARMDKFASDIEDIKHDFRLFVKRSIYIR